MGWKIGSIIGIVLLLAMLGIAIYMKITQSTESQKAKGNIINYTFEPHQTFGCARYIAPQPEK